MDQSIDFITLAIVMVVVLGVCLALFWRLALRPLQVCVREVVPLLEGLTKTLPETSATQREMIARSQAQELSLKDAVGLLEDAADRSRYLDERSRDASEALKMALHGDRVLAKQDREQLEKLVVLLDRLAMEQVQVATDLTAREKKIDAASSGVASDLAERQRIIDKLSNGVALDLAERQRLIDLASAGVASDLAEAQQRADDTSGPSGTAADAAAQSPQEDRRKTEDRRAEPRETGDRRE